MNTENFFQSNSFKRLAWILGGLIVALFIFKAGEFVGFLKAKTSFDWGDNYYRNFGGMKNNERGMMGGGFRLGGMMEEDAGLIKSHGVSGQFLKNSGDNIIIKTNEGLERIVKVSSTTVLRRFRDSIKVGDIEVNENLVVIGDPTKDGNIDAKLIRVMPNMMTPISK